MSVVLVWLNSSKTHQLTSVCHWIRSQKIAELFCRGCQFSSTATRRRQNHTRFRLRDEQVTLSPVEGCIHFRQRLLFLFASSSIKTTIPGVKVCGCKIILGQLE
jgi:hypothetical protein